MTMALTLSRGIPVIRHLTCSKWYNWALYYLTKIWAAEM